MKRSLFFIFLFFWLSYSSFSWALEGCPFQGQIDFLQKKIDIVLGQEDHSLVKAQFIFLSDNNFHLNFNLEHLKTSLFAISSQLESSVVLIEDPKKRERYYSGQFQTKYSLLNYKPVDEISGNFEIKDQILFLPDLLIGRVRLQGSLELFYPYKVDLSVQLKEIPMDEFLSLWMDVADMNSQGAVSGNINISGVLNRLILKGSLASYQGMVKQLKYDSIILNLEGEYPVLQLANSTVTQSDGISFNIDGN